jgi:four helix bundle protein
MMTPTGMLEVRWGMQKTENLKVARHARKLAVLVYRVTEAFPRDERFGLTAQMRRAAVSIGSNIAEGCGRSGDRELVRFVRIASGSASELEFQTLLAMDLGFASVSALERLLDAVDQEKRMLARLVVGIRERNRLRDGSID